MIQLYDKETGASLGAITEEQLQFLADQLEEESPQDQDYYINEPTLDAFEEAGADPALVALLLVTWRGYQGEDAPEHLVMGEALPRLLEVFGVPFRAPPPEALEPAVDWAAACIRETRRPVALVVRPGIFE